MDLFMRLGILGLVSTFQSGHSYAIPSKILPIQRVDSVRSV